mmetsp:Transcript_6315/g.15634  ORF Transcript_6315/g.15634 Transcript_6315/m.15634 type:complete len:206 (-) Transcript_6315:2450-3067(-)
MILIAITTPARGAAAARSAGRGSASPAGSRRSGRYAGPGAATGSQRWRRWRAGVATRSGTAAAVSTPVGAGAARGGASMIFRQIRTIAHCILLPHPRHHRRVVLRALLESRPVSGLGEEPLAVVALVLLAAGRSSALRWSGRRAERGGDPIRPRDHWRTLQHLPSGRHRHAQRRRRLVETLAPTAVADVTSILRLRCHIQSPRLS